MEMKETRTRRGLTLLVATKKGTELETHLCSVRFVLGVCEKGSSTKTPGDPRWGFSSLKKGPEDKNTPTSVCFCAQYVSSSAYVVSKNKNIDERVMCKSSSGPAYATKTRRGEGTNLLAALKSVVDTFISI